MDMDRLRQLVEAEVRRVLAGGSVSETSAPAPRLLVLFTGTSVAIDTALTQLQALLEQGYRLSVALCPMAEELVGIQLSQMTDQIEMLSGEPIAKASLLLDAYEAVVIPTLSRTAAAKLALGIADNFVLTLAMQALLSGKRVVAARNGADPDVTDHPSVGTARTPEPLIQLARDYLQTLEAFGVQLIDVSQLSEQLSPDKTEQYTSADPGKTLITESVIANLSPQVQELVVPNPAIITPLARDLAREKGISLRLEKR